MGFVRWKPGELLEYERRVMSQPVQVPGRVVEDVLIPAHGFLPAREVRRGQVFRLIDVEGQQVPDVILFDRNNLNNPSSCINTMLVQKKWRLGKGDVIYSRLGDRMATIIEDTVGVHFWFGGMCNNYINKLRYGTEGTANCLSNMVASMARYGFREQDIPLDACVAFFMNVQVNPDGSLLIAEPLSRPGDYIDLRAEMDLIVAVSNCPQERNPCNAWNPTPMRFVIWEPA